MARFVSGTIAIVAVATLMGFVAVAASRGGPPTVVDRTMSIAEGLRCPVCRGESAAASSSPAAVQIREEIARQLAQGRSDDQIKAWFAVRYGPSILMDPPTDGVGWAAWAGPVVLLGAGVLLVARVLRRPDDITAEEAA